MSAVDSMVITALEDRISFGVICVCSKYYAVYYSTQADTITIHLNDIVFSISGVHATRF